MQVQISSSSNAYSTKSPDLSFDESSSEISDKFTSGIKLEKKLSLHSQLSFVFFVTYFIFFTNISFVMSLSTAIMVSPSWIT